MAGPNEIDRLDALLDAFDATVRRRRPDLTAPVDAEGFRRVTAAALLFRGLELLSAGRACRGQVFAPAAELVLRSATEAALRGRFLLGPTGGDELIRMTGDFIRRGTRLAEVLGTEFGGMSSAFLAAVAPSNKEGGEQAAEDPNGKPATRPKPRNLYEISKALDLQNGLSEDHRASSVRAYRVFYGALSESAAHSGLAALRRFTEMRNGRAAVTAKPEPLTGDRRLHLIVGGLLGELARELFMAFGIATDDLDELGVRLALPDDGPNGVDEAGG